MTVKSNVIPGYLYGDPVIGKSPVTLAELESLKVTVGFSSDDASFLKEASEVLAPQVRRIVEHWRSEIIAGIPHLARHSRAASGKALPNYLDRSNRRFEQWIVDTCLRPYDQTWLDYQHEIALRHTAVRKNQADHVDSTPYIPFRDVIGFVAVMNETLKPYLRVNGHSDDDVEKMHRAWCKSLQLQISLWARPYSDPTTASGEW